MNDFSIGAMKARNIAAQFGVFEKAQNTEISSEETAEEIVKARNVGDVHANGKWVWTEYKPGRFDWRPLKGRGGVDRTPKKGDEGAAVKKEDGSDKHKLAERRDALSAEIKKINNQIMVNGDSVREVLQDKKKKLESEREDIVKRLSKMSSDTQESPSEDKKKTPTVDDHAKKTPTKTLENAAKSDKAPGSIKGAAEAELKARKDAEIAKKLNLHSKGELATALTKIASEWDSYNDSEKTIIKQSISQARGHIIEEIEGGNFSTETMSYLADLQSIENYIKKTDSEPKPVGDIIKNLMSDLKAKTVADTTAGKEKVKGIANKATALADGKSISFSANGKEIELKKERTFDDGTSQYALYEGGMGRYTSGDAEKAVKTLLDFYPEAKEVRGKKEENNSDEDKTDSFIKNGLEEVVTNAMDEYDGDFPGAVTAKDYYNDEDFQEYLHNLLPEDIDIGDVWGEVQKFVKRILKNRK